MGILRTDVVSHSQLEGSGSVELDGVGDYLSFGSHSAFSPATADITIELWFYLTDGTNLSSGNYYLCDMGSNGYRFQIYNGGLYWAVDPNDYVGPINNVLSNNTWHHIAGVRDGNALELYLDGVHLGTKITTASVTSTTFTIGSYSTGGGDYEPYGYISNLRYVRGVVYKGPFTPPKFELKNIPGTIVLGCQSTTSATDFAVTPSTVTANGDAAASAFHPGLKKDVIETGVVFDGVTTFDSQAFMVPPSGKTTERNRGRGFYMLGYNGTPSASASSRIDYINIQSQGNTTKFGDLTVNRYSLGAGANSTRGLFNGGYQDGHSPDTDVNTIEFITIATEGNATDFGDRIMVGRAVASASNDTRCVMASAFTPAGYQNIIDFVLFATTANATDFGDLSTARAGMSMSCNSTTRGIFSGGYQPAPSTIRVNNMEFITFATTGNTQDFGDLTDDSQSTYGGTASSSTRGLIGLGYVHPARVNSIDFCTIATTGNALDFGDLQLARNAYGSCSNSTRGIFLGGNDPYTNIIDMVNIATTGDATDFGDVSVGVSGLGAAGSDSHGGLS